MLSDLTSRYGFSVDEHRYTRWGAFDSWVIVIEAEGSVIKTKLTAFPNRIYSEVLHISERSVTNETQWASYVTGCLLNLLYHGEKVADEFQFDLSEADTVVGCLDI